MLRAWLVAAACWIGVGALGLGVGAAHAEGGRGADLGFVTAPAEPESHVVESRPLAWSALAERSQRGVDHAPGRLLAVAARGAHVGRGAWPLPCSLDARRVSRTSVSASRRVDLRREALRARPGRRAGHLDAASHTPS